MMEQELDFGFGQRYKVIVHNDYKIHTIIDLRENRKIYHENRPKLFDKIQVLLLNLKNTRIL